MTRKLFYEDSYLSIFTANVIACNETAKGYEVVLNQTAFYPEGGGQPADIGTLNDIEVTYVYEKQDIIYHCVKAPITVGCEVQGKVAFNRRFDFMQQHSGEHIISGLVHAHYGFNNVGFHMSAEYTTCDFDGELTSQQLQVLEEEANKAIYEDLEVDCIIYPHETIKDRDYRSKLDLTGNIRLVTVPGYDVCACCGTHVRTTGEIGLIKITGVERHRGGIRVTMLCGERALHDYQNKHEVLGKMCQALSAKTGDVLEKFAKVQGELSASKQLIAELTSELLGYKSKVYLKVDQPEIFVYEETLTPDMIRRFCLLLTEQTEKPVLVLAGNEPVIKYALGSKSEDIREINKALTETFKGKGGGKSGLCQGNISGTIEDIENFYRSVARSRA